MVRRPKNRHCRPNFIIIKMVESPNFRSGKSKFQKGKENWKAKQENKGDSYKKQNSDTNHGDSSNHKKGKGEKKPFDKRKIQCYNCSKFGHFANECRSGKGGKHK